MQKKFIYSYLFIFITLLVMLSISRYSVDQARGIGTSIFTPFWEKILFFKYTLANPGKPSPFQTFSMDEQLKHLEVENQLLKTELSNLNRFIQEQILLVKELEQIAFSSSEDNPELEKKHIEKKISLLKNQVKAVPARVIFRSFDTWNNSFWINAGELTENDNIIAKNSPVVIGKAIVGVVDYVGKTQSRVRLITDSRLTPSVRAARGGEQDLHLKDCIENLLRHIDRKNQLPLSPNSQKQLTELLNQLREQLISTGMTTYLAKGELQGSVSHSRKGTDLLLKGTGFNYDFTDEEGEGRDLRTGRPFNQLNDPPVPILKINDILVTTGMDGIFPPGFQVGIVTHIHLLKEGDYFYSLEAKPIVRFLEELSLVFVLPPMSQEEF